MDDYFCNSITGWGRQKYKLKSDVLRMDFWPLLEQCHPYRNEIIRAAKTLDQIGASSSLIAAAMGQKDWKNFFRDRTWTHIDL
jgi:hypothetical protein